MSDLVCLAPLTAAIHQRLSTGLQSCSVPRGKLKVTGINNVCVCVCVCVCVYLGSYLCEKKFEF